MITNYSLEILVKVIQTQVAENAELVFMYDIYEVHLPSSCYDIRSLGLLFGINE